MSRAAQQRVIEEHQATIRDLKRQLAQAKAELGVYDELVALCDDHEVAGQTVVPVTLLRKIRPKGHGLP